MELQRRTNTKLPIKLSVRVLRQTYKTPEKTSKPHLKQDQPNYNIKVIPPCHIETQKTITSQQQSFNFQSQRQYQTTNSYNSIAVPKRRRKIFDRTKNSKSMKNDEKGAVHNETWDKQLSSALQHDVTTFRNIPGHENYPNPNIFYEQNTIKYDRPELLKTPTVKDLSPQVQPKSNWAQDNSKGSFQQSSLYHSPKKQQSSENSQNTAKPNWIQSPSVITQLKSDHQKRLKSLQSNFEEHENEISRLNSQLKNYISKSEQSQQVVLSELNKNSLKLLNKEKQILLDHVQIRNLQKKNSIKEQQILKYKLQLERSKRIQQLSTYNQQLYQSLLKSNTRLTHDNTTNDRQINLDLPYSINSHRKCFQEKNDIKILSPIVANRSYHHHYSEQQFVSSVIQEPILFPNSISALYSPPHSKNAYMSYNNQTDNRSYDAYENDDTLKQLLSPLCINPDYL